uniref:CRAL-TRIO domain-containing protein n=1 Tax=viral metagenome TaxID=1070528 RepID=A0A6C0AZ04_9ZZZZ
MNISLSESMKEETTIQRSLHNHFSKNEPLQNTKKNIIKICLTELLSKLCFVIDNQIVLDYRYFKFIATKENYQFIIQYIVSIMETMIKGHDQDKNTLTFHVNMSSITLLHIEKYYSFIQELSEVLKQTFPDTLETCYIYNAPFIFSKLFSVVSVFIDKKTLSKIKLIQEN